MLRDAPTLIPAPHRREIPVPTPAAGRDARMLHGWPTPRSNPLSLGAMLHPKKQILPHSKEKRAVGDGVAPMGMPAAQPPRWRWGPYAPPPPPPDYNLAQIIILNYNLQQTQSPICLILALPPPQYKPPGWGERGAARGANPSSGVEEAVGRAPPARYRRVRSRQGDNIGTMRPPRRQMCVNKAAAP